MVLATDRPHGASRRAPPLLFRLLLLDLEPLHRLEDYLRVAEEVLSDDLLDIFALIRIKVADRTALVGCPRRDRRGDAQDPHGASYHSPHMAAYPNSAVPFRSVDHAIPDDPTGGKEG